MFRAYRVFSLLRPSRPRHPIVQALLALFAICAFIVVLVVGVVVAATVMLAGTLLRAFGPVRPVAVASNAQPRPRVDTTAAGADIIDGEFRVVDKPIGHGTR